MKTIHYEFETDNEDYEGEWDFSVTTAEIRTAIVNIYLEKYCKNEHTNFDDIDDFINAMDIEDELYKILDDEIKDYFEPRAYKEFLELREI